MSDLYFPWCVAFTLEAEGKFVNDPADSGGPTNMGIRLQTLKTWRAAHGKPEPSVQDVKDLKTAEAAEIYKVAYWDQIKAGAIFDPVVALGIFDLCVVTGMDGAARVAQRAVCDCAAPITIDGILGSKTIAAINNIQRRVYMRAFCAQRDERSMDCVVASPKNAKFLTGWLLRCAKIKAFTLTDIPVPKVTT